MLNIFDNFIEYEKKIRGFKIYNKDFLSFVLLKGQYWEEKIQNWKFIPYSEKKFGKVHLKKCILKSQVFNELFKNNFALVICLRSHIIVKF